MNFFGVRGIAELTIEGELAAVGDGEGTLFLRHGVFQSFFIRVDLGLTACESKIAWFRLMARWHRGWSRTVTVPPS